jgi:hypothetical protein
MSSMYRETGNVFLYLLIGALLVMGLGFYFKQQMASSNSENYKTTTINPPLIPTPNPTSLYFEASSSASPSALPR